MTYTGHLDTRGKMRGASDLILRPVQALEDLPLVRRKRDKDLGALAAHTHQPDRRFGIALDDLLEDYADGIGLGLESRRLVVSVATAFAVVYDNHHCF